MIPNWSKISMSLPLNHFRSILYHSEPLEVPYSQNQFLGLDFFVVSYSKLALIERNNNWKHLVVLVLRIFFLSFSGLSTWGRKVGRKFDQIKINDPNEKLHYVVTPPSPASSSIHARPASSICSNSHEDHNCTLLVISIFQIQSHSIL